MALAGSREYAPSLHLSIASHGSDDLFNDNSVPFVDRPFVSHKRSALGLQLTAEPNSSFHAERAASISDSTRSIESLPASTVDAHPVHDPPAASYFESRPSTEQLPPSSLPRSTRERNLNRLSQEIEHSPLLAAEATESQFPAPLTSRPVSHASSRPPSVSSRPPSIVLSRPYTPARSASRASSRPRSLAEEIHDIGEEVPVSDLSDDEEGDVSWTTVLSGGTANSYLVRSSESSFERQRTAFPPPRSRTSSISRSISGGFMGSRTPSFSGRSTFSARSGNSPSHTPETTRPKIHAGRHSLQIEHLPSGSPFPSLASPRTEDRIAPKRSNSIVSLPAFRSLRSFRSNRRKGEPEVANITVPPTYLSADLPSPVPELPNEHDGDVSASSSAHSRENSPYARFPVHSMPPQTPTRTAKARISLSKIPKVFKKSNSSASPKIVTTVETSEEVSSNGDVIERTTTRTTTRRRPSAGSRLSYKSHTSQRSNLSAPGSGSIPATTCTPDHYVENSSVHYVTNVSSRSATPPPPPSPVTPLKAVLPRKEIKPIMIVDYTHSPRPQKIPTPGMTPSRPTAPGPPVRSTPSTPSTATVVTDSSAPVLQCPEPFVPVTTPAERAAEPRPAEPKPVQGAAPATPCAQPSTHVSTSSTATVELADILAEGPTPNTPAPATTAASAHSALPRTPETTSAVDSVLEPRAAPATTTINIDVKDGEVTTVSAPSPAPSPVPSSRSASAKTAVSASPSPTLPPTDAENATSQLAAMVDIAPKTDEVKIKTAPAAATAEPQTIACTEAVSPEAETGQHAASPKLRSRSPARSSRSVDARVRRSSKGSGVSVSPKSQRGVVDVHSPGPQETTDNALQYKEQQPKDADKKAEPKPRARPEHVKHHSADAIPQSIRHSLHDHPVHMKHHSVEMPRYSRSISYDHHAPSRLAPPLSGVSSRRNSLDSNASYATLDSAGVHRKRRILNPMSLEFSSSESESDDGTDQSAIEIEYKTEASIDVKIIARITPMPSRYEPEVEVDSGEESDVESVVGPISPPLGDDNDETRAQLRERIQAAERLMKENPRLPSEIDAVPDHTHSPGTVSIPPLHTWPRALNPTLRPLYLGGHAFGTPVSAGMMPGLGYAAGTLGLPTMPGFLSHRHVAPLHHQHLHHPHQGDP